MLAFADIAMVGILNIFTSFALSFLLAVRARNIGEAQSHRCSREVGRELLANRSLSYSHVGSADLMLATIRE